MKEKIKKMLSDALLLCMVLTMLSTIPVQAKTRELYTSLWQKSNDMYEYCIDSGMAVAHKVKLNKNTIVIYGSMSDFTDTDSIYKHTYRLAKSVKFVSRGGEDADQKMSKKEFKAYLKNVRDSGLGLVLEFKNNKVTCVAISS